MHIFLKIIVVSTEILINAKIRGFKYCNYDNMNGDNKKYNKDYYYALKSILGHKYTIYNILKINNVGCFFVLITVVIIY